MPRLKLLRSLPRLKKLFALLLRSTPWWTPPPCRDANDYLVSSASNYWNDIDGTDYTAYPTAGAVPTDRRSQSFISQVDRGRKTAPTPDGNRDRKVASQDRGDITPAMPLLIDEEWSQVYPKGLGGEPPDDPFGFGLQHRDTISRFVEEHREKYSVDSDAATSIN